MQSRALLRCILVREFTEMEDYGVHITKGSSWQWHISANKKNYHKEVSCFCCSCCVHKPESYNGQIPPWPRSLDWGHDFKCFFFFSLSSLAHYGHKTVNHSISVGRHTQASVSLARTVKYVGGIHKTDDRADGSISWGLLLFLKVSGNHLSSWSRHHSIDLWGRVWSPSGGLNG